jgi:hypothetical protein
VSTRNRRYKKKKVEEKSFEVVAKRRTREERIACHRCPFRVSKHRSRVLCERARRACTVLEINLLKNMRGERATRGKKEDTRREKKAVSIFLTFVDLHLHRRIIGVTTQLIFTRHRLLVRSFVRSCDFFTQSSASSSSSSFYFCAALEFRSSVLFFAPKFGSRIINQGGTKFWEFFAEPFLRLTTKTIFQLGRCISRVTKQRIADLPVPENREEVFKRNERIFTEHLEWNSDDFWKHRQAVHFQKLLRDDDDATSSPNRITAPTLLTPINVNSTGKNE